MSLPLAAAEPPVDVRFGRHPGYWRMAIEWAAPPLTEVRIDGELVELGPVALTRGVGQIQTGLGQVVRYVAYEDRTLRLHLREGFTAERLEGVAATILAVDFRADRNAAVRSAAAQARRWVPRRRGDALVAAPAPQHANATVGHEVRADDGQPANSSAEQGGAETEATPPSAARLEPGHHRPPADTLPPLPDAIAGNSAEHAATSSRASRARPVPLPAADGRGDAHADAPVHGQITAAPSPPSLHEPVIYGGAAVRMPIDRVQSERVATAAVPPLPPRAEQRGAVPAEEDDPAPAPAPVHAPRTALAPAHAPGSAPAVPVLDNGIGYGDALTPLETHGNAGGEVVVEPGDAAAGGGEAFVERGARVRASEGGFGFTFSAPVAAAAWRRGTQLWLVFEAVEPMVDIPPELRDRVQRLPHDEAIVFRLNVATMDALALAREGATWRVSRAAAAPAAAPPARAPTLPPSGDAARISIEDLWLGDTVHVVASLDDVGLAAGRRQSERIWLPTLQGFAYRDLSRRGAAPETSPLEARAAPSELMPSLPRQAAGGLIGLAAPTLMGDAAADHRIALENSLFADAVPVRRLALVRFLLGQAAPFDALAVLAAAPVATAPDPAAGEITARLQALKAVAAVLADRLDVAAAIMPPAVDDADPEIWLWNAMLACARGAWSRCGVDFARSGQAWRSYPLPLRQVVARYAVEAAIELDAPQVALAVLEQVPQDDFTTRAAARLALLRARAELGAGQVAAGERRLASLAEPPTEPDVRREAEMLLTIQHLDAERIEPSAALAALEASAVGWTGRPGADRFWSEVARLRGRSGDAVGAFDAWSRRAHEPPKLTSEQEDLLRALVAGDPPFEKALADAVVLVDDLDDRIAPGPARAELFGLLAARVADETSALHIADALYRRAIAEPQAHAVDLDLRLRLAALRIERYLPGAALEALFSLDETVDQRIAPLRARALAMQSRPIATSTTIDSARTEPQVIPSGDVDGTLRAIDELLADTQALLDGES